MSKFDISKLAVGKKNDISLTKFPTKAEKLYRSDDDYEKKLQFDHEKLAELQELLYAQNEHALLLVFHGMDSAGKDGAIKHVMSGINPQGCAVHSFKQPSAEELQHDFLWRAAVRLPERGRIGIFNRSYYEDVLVVRVHPDILKSQRLPLDRVKDLDKVWSGRYKSIRNFEKHLYRSGTTVIKFYLHLSREEQRERLLTRLKEKIWKFSENDISQRAAWDKYMKAYQECLSNTSTTRAPWYIIPADDKKNARLIISQIVIEHLEALDLHVPEAPEMIVKERRKFERALRKSR